VLSSSSLKNSMAGATIGGGRAMRRAALRLGRSTLQLEGDGGAAMGGRLFEWRVTMALQWKGQQRRRACVTMVSFLSQGGEGGRREGKGRMEISQQLARLDQLMELLLVGGLANN
jgi:hypothetical protein